MTFLFKGLDEGGGKDDWVGWCSCDFRTKQVFGVRCDLVVWGEEIGGDVKLRFSVKWLGV